MIPAKWKTETLAKVAELVGGGTPARSRKEFFGSDIDWVTPSDLPPIGEVRLLGQVAEKLTWNGLEQSSAKALPEGAVLFSSRASIGKIAVAGRPCCTNQGFANFIVHPGVIDPWYLAYYLAAKTPDILALAGTTTFKEVSRGKLRLFPISFPPTAEQGRMVARIKECMDRIDELTRLRAQTRVEARSLLPAYLNDISKSVRHPSIPLRELLEQTQNGRSIRSSGEPGNGAVLTLSAVRSLTLDLSAKKAVTLDEEVARKYQVRTGDVFVSRSNTRELVGLSAIVTGEPQLRTIYPDLLIRLTPSLPRLRPRYLTYALRFPDVRRQIQDRATGTSQSMVKISADRLREVCVPVPPLDAQDALVDQMDEAYQACSSLRDSLVQSDVGHLRSAVLRKVFEGDL